MCHIKVGFSWKIKGCDDFPQEKELELENKWGTEQNTSKTITKEKYRALVTGPIQYRKDFVKNKFDVDGEISEVNMYLKTRIDVNSLSIQKMNDILDGKERCVEYALEANIEGDGSENSPRIILGKIIINPKESLVYFNQID